MHFRESTPKGIIYPLNRKLGRGASPMQIAVSRTKGKEKSVMRASRLKNDKNQGNIFNHRGTRVVENQFTRWPAAFIVRSNVLWTVRCGPISFTSLSFLRREAIILNSVPWPLFHPMGGPMRVQPPWSAGKKKKAATQGPERGTRRRRCRSIYIIINRKEIYLIPRPKDSLFPLRLIWIHLPLADGKLESNFGVISCY